MISSTSQRLPLKTCGLFDTGFAGDTDDVTSLGLGVPTDVDQDLFSLEDLQHFVSNDNDSITSTAASTYEPADAKLEMVSVPDMDWATDLLDPLGGLDDPLGDDSLDAFVNLDTLLMGDAFLDEAEPGSILEELEDTSFLMEVQPVIQFTQPAAEKPATAKPTRKRKATGKPKATAIKTSMFEIAADHDYTAKQQKLSPPCEVKSPQTATASGSGTGKAKIENKQVVRRIKNNVASKRSREQRKAKVVEMDQEVEYLIGENERLRNSIVELEKSAKEMKAILVAKMTGQA